MDDGASTANVEGKQKARIMRYSGGHRLTASTVMPSAADGYRKLALA